MWLRFFYPSYQFLKQPTKSFQFNLSVSGFESCRGTFPFREGSLYLCVELAIFIPSKSPRIASFLSSPNGSQEQRYRISFECEWNFQIYSLLALVVALFTQTQLSQIYSQLLIFTYECLFTPKKSKNLLTSWVELPVKTG